MAGHDGLLWRDIPVCLDCTGYRSSSHGVFWSSERLRGGFYGPERARLHESGAAVMAFLASPAHGQGASEASRRNHAAATVQKLSEQWLSWEMVPRQPSWRANPYL